MSSGSARPDHEPSRYPTHRPDDAGAGWDATADVDGAWFAVVLRGYDRGQVEDRLAELDRRIHEEIRRAESAESALRATRTQLSRLQEQQETRSAPAPSDAGFGSRVERVLQAAEDEAAEVRTRAESEAADIRERAENEAAGIRERAREDAEAHRTRIEEALLGRAATLDREFTSRSTALDEREREAAERLEAARSEVAEVEELRDTARAELDRARIEAADRRREAEQVVTERRSGLARDLDRLTALRDDVRAELDRVRSSLSAELDREPVAASLDDDLFGPVGVGGTDPLAGSSPVDPLDPLGDTVRHIEDRDTGGDTGGDTGRDTGRDTGTPETGVPETADREPEARDTDRPDGNGTLLPGPGRLPGTDAPDGEETTIGRIPPISLTSIGVLPFGDLAAGGDDAGTRTNGVNGVSLGHGGPTRGPGPGQPSR